MASLTADLVDCREATMWAVQRACEASEDGYATAREIYDCLAWELRQAWSPQFFSRSFMRSMRLDGDVETKFDWARGRLQRYRLPQVR